MNFNRMCILLLISLPLVSCGKGPVGNTSTIKSDAVIGKDNRVQTKNRKNISGLQKRVGQIHIVFGKGIFK